MTDTLVEDLLSQPSSVSQTLKQGSGRVDEHDDDEPTDSGLGAEIGESLFLISVYFVLLSSFLQDGVYQTSSSSSRCSSRNIGVN